MHDSSFPLNDDDSLSREAWHLFGIMSEFVEAIERLRGIPPAVSVFGSSRVPRDHPYYRLAEDLAHLLSDAGFSVVSGGGPGLMEAVSRGAFLGPAPSVGLNIELPGQEPPNGYLDVSLHFRHFFARKHMFIRLSAAYVVLPGGFGTMDELMEALCLIQTGKTPKIPVILLHRPFWQGLIGWFRDTLLREEMIAEKDLGLLQVVDTPKEALDAIFAFYLARGFGASTREKEIRFFL